MNEPDNKPSEPVTETVRERALRKLAEAEHARFGRPAKSSQHDLDGATGKPGR